MRAARANSAEVARLQSELERISSENTRLASEAEEAKVLLDCRDKEAEGNISTLHTSLPLRQLP